MRGRIWIAPGGYAPSKVVRRRMRAAGTFRDVRAEGRCKKTKPPYNAKRVKARREMARASRRANRGKGRGSKRAA